MQRTLTKDELLSVFPRARDDILDEVVGLDDPNITDSKERYCAFIAQTGYESDGFSTTIEHISDRLAEQNYGYTTRTGKILGNTKAGDGARYKGRGLIQLTGRYNYEHIGHILSENLVDSPLSVAEPRMAMETAIAFWLSKDCSVNMNHDDFEGVTRKISGHTVSNKARELLYKKLLALYAP